VVFFFFILSLFVWIAKKKTAQPQSFEFSDIGRIYIFMLLGRYHGGVSSVCSVLLRAHEPCCYCLVTGFFTIGVVYDLSNSVAK